MSEEAKILKAQKFVTAGDLESAEKLVWELYQSKNPLIKLNAILLLDAVISPVEHNEKLFELAEEGIVIAKQIGARDALGILFCRKASSLAARLGLMTHRKSCLNLSASVFNWIEFALEDNKNEYAHLVAEGERINLQIEDLERLVLEHIKDYGDSSYRSQIYMSLGELYSSKFMQAKADLMQGGSFKTMIANQYWAKEIGIEKYLLFNRKSRKTMHSIWKQCMKYFEMSISESLEANDQQHVAFAYYNLAIKYSLEFKFKKSNNLLDKAEPIAKQLNEGRLLQQIKDLRENNKNKNRGGRDYVREFGLDMP